MCEAITRLVSKPNECRDIGAESTEFEVDEEASLQFAESSKEDERLDRTHVY